MAPHNCHLHRRAIHHNHQQGVRRLLLQAVQGGADLPGRGQQHGGGGAEQHDDRQGTCGAVLCREGLQRQAAVLLQPADEGGEGVPGLRSFHHLPAHCSVSGSAVLRRHAGAGRHDVPRLPGVLHALPADAQLHFPEHWGRVLLPHDCCGGSRQGGGAHEQEAGDQPRVRLHPAQLQWQGGAAGGGAQVPCTAPHHGAGRPVICH
mmetsp:Transcript_37098/g.82530  ORF Transcript_37098/g.82530 Transcript_37098/m.82530 type:complete len:205 (-) Transcript_37098:1046-1660(-)